MRLLADPRDLVLDRLHEGEKLSRALERAPSLGAQVDEHRMEPRHVLQLGLDDRILLAVAFDVGERLARHLF